MTSQLLHVSRQCNEAACITGRMLYADGHFIQTLEGPEPAVDAMFEWIGRDPRHRDVLVALREPIALRDFPDWSMGFDTATVEGPRSCRDSRTTSTGGR